MPRLRTCLPWLLCGALLGCTERAPAPSPTPPAASPSARPTSAVGELPVQSEVLDRDGDGRPDTWLTTDEHGQITQGRDTDGDGKPDVFEAVDALRPPPEGFPIGPASSPSPQPPR